MDQATLVETQIQNVKRLIDRLVGQGVPVTAACWVKESESGQWFLYFATALVGENGATKSAYRRVNAVIREIQKEGFWIDPLEVKLIGPDDPIAKAMVSVRDRNPGRFPSWFRGNRLGSVATEEAYIYPPRMDGQWVYVFEYQRQGQTTHWDAISPGQCVRWDPQDRWIDGEVRVAQQGGKVVISIYSEEALQEEDATPAEELANQEFRGRFPGHTIVYPPDRAE
jgi:hypothetical protein